MNFSNDQSALPGFLFRLVGYGLLTMSFFNVIDILVPLRLMDANWEFQTFGALVESSVIPLLGFALVFYGRLENRKPLELLLLYGLSWLTLLFALLSFLLIPLGLSNAVKINRQNFARINAQSSQQVTQIQKLQNELSSATETQLKTLLQQISIKQGPVPDIKTPQELKERLQDNLIQVEKSSKENAAAEFASKRFELIKRCVKWGLGAVIVGFIFLQVWRETRWIRVLIKR